MLKGTHLVAGEWIGGSDSFTNEPVSGDADSFAVGTVDLVNQACEAVFALQDIVNRTVRRRAGVPLTIRHLLRVVAFAASHGTGRYTFSQNIVLGCRFFVADQLGQEAGGMQQGIRHRNHSELMNAVNDWLPFAEANLSVPSREWLLGVFSPPGSMGQCHNALQVLASDGSIRCRYAGVIAVPAERQRPGVSESKVNASATVGGDVSGTGEADWGSAEECASDVDLPQTEALRSRTRMTFTPTMLLNVARIIAAQVSRSPLLLEGPPGIGAQSTVPHRSVSSRALTPQFGCRQIICNR